MQCIRILAFVVAVPALLHAQSGSFTVSQRGHAVGTASFQISAGGGGFESTAVVQVQMNGLDYALSKTEQLGPAHNLIHVQLSATVNGAAVRVTGKPDAGQFLVNISANGRASTTPLEFHPATVFLPDFDPGALQTLLIVAAAQNNRDLWVLIPRGKGAVSAVELATLPDEQGTLDGKPMAVHHLQATVAGAETDIFSGAENELLQAELPQAGFALVRTGFVLTPPKRPLAPPQQPAEPMPATPQPGQTAAPAPGY